MLHILFSPGMFGSTVQYLLRTYNPTYHKVAQSLDQALRSDGSMHGYTKTGHYNLYALLESFLDQRLDNAIDISTPVYPMEDAHADKIIELIQTRRPQDPVVFLYADSMDYAEINLLARYHKVAGADATEAIRLLVGNYYFDIEHWNTDYQHWTDMQPWELREWLSIFYPGYVDEWITAHQYISPQWLAVSTREILNNTEQTFKHILEYSGNLVVDSSFKTFCQEWRGKQQYILDEYAMINTIVDHAINNRHYTWPAVHFVAETIVQKKLRDRGYELKCFDLNVFPTTAEELHQLLEKI
jgi:hypothetical protein